MASGLRIRDLPPGERPRERLVNSGAEALKNSELIAILLRTGTRGLSALEIAERLMKQFESLDNLSRAGVEDLQRVRGIGRDKAIALKSAFTLAHRMVLEIRSQSPLLDGPELIANLLREQNRAYAVETFQAFHRR